MIHLKILLKKTKDIKNEFNSLSISNLNNSKVIDEAVKEIQTIIKFVGQSFNKKDIEGVTMTLSISLINQFQISIKLAPQSSYNDMSNIDIRHSRRTMHS